MKSKWRIINSNVDGKDFHYTLSNGENKIVGYAKISEERGIKEIKEGLEEFMKRNNKISKYS